MSCTFLDLIDAYALSYGRSDSKGKRSAEKQRLLDLNDLQYLSTTLRDPADPSATIPVQAHRYLIIERGSGVQTLKSTRPSSRMM